VNALMGKLIAAAPVVTDGAWGTQLFARGLGVGQCPDAWNITHRGQVEMVTGKPVWKTSPAAVAGQRRRTSSSAASILISRRAGLIKWH